MEKLSSFGAIARERLPPSCVAAAAVVDIGSISETTQVSRQTVPVGQAIRSDVIGDARCHDLLRSPPADARAGTPP